MAGHHITSRDVVGPGVVCSTCSCGKVFEGAAADDVDAAVMQHLRADPYILALRLSLRQRVADEAAAGLARARARGEGPDALALAERVTVNVQATVDRLAAELEAAVSSAIDKELS